MYIHPIRMVAKLGLYKQKSLIFVNKFSVCSLLAFSEHQNSLKCVDHLKD